MTTSDAVTRQRGAWCDGPLLAPIDSLAVVRGYDDEIMATCCTRCRLSWSRRWSGRPASRGATWPGGGTDGPCSGHASADSRPLTYASSSVPSRRRSRAWKSPQPTAMHTTMMVQAASAASNTAPTPRDVTDRVNETKVEKVMQVCQP